MDRCLSNPCKNYTFDMLLEAVNDKLQDLEGTIIAVRQLRDDLRNIQKIYNTTIITTLCEYKKPCYRYEEEGFSIYKNGLSEEDLNKLSSTIEMLGKYRGGPANVWLEEMISTLEYRFGVKSNPENLVSFEQNEQLQGLEFLSEIIDATVNHQTLEVVYQPYKGEEKSYVLHPYYVKQYNGRWFLMGVVGDYNTISNLAIDRIRSIKHSGIKFRKNDTHDFNTYFDDIIGVSFPKESVEKETIRLRFTKDRFPYVVTKPIHPSQVVTDEEDCIIELCVKPNRELNQRIFSYIPDIEVMSPQNLRDEIKKKIEDNLKKY